MSWYGTHAKASKEVVRLFLPPGACKHCVYWYRVAMETGFGQWHHKYKACPRCGIVFSEVSRESGFGMHYLKLLKMAEDLIAKHPDAKVDSFDDRLLLSMTEPKKHNGYRVRLFRDRGPYALIINGVRGKLTVYVSARRVRDFLNGYVVKSELE